MPILEHLFLIKVMVEDRAVPVLMVVEAVAVLDNLVSMVQDLMVVTLMLEKVVMDNHYLPFQLQF